MTDSSTWCLRLTKKELECFEGMDSISGEFFNLKEYMGESSQSEIFLSQENKAFLTK